MDFDQIIKFGEKWGKLIGFLTAVGALLSIFLANTWLSYILLIISWLMVSLWLWQIASQRKAVRKALLVEGTQLPKIYKNYQRRLAAIGIVFITISVWGWIGWQVWSNFRPQSSPTLEIFPEDKFGIIIAEFTQGSQERSSFSGGADVRDKLYNDVLRLVAQQGLGSRIAVQQAGLIKSQGEALEFGQKYGAELVIWGYVPINQPNSFRPSFALLAINEDLQTIDPILFSAEIIGEDIIEANTLLTKRVRIVSSFVLGVIYMAEGQPGDYQLAISIFDQAIIEANNELSENEDSQEDLAFNLALFHLMRGRAFAALGNEASALEDYHQALEFRPNFARVHAAIGNVYYYQRDFETAQDYYETAKTNWRGVFGLGLVSYHQDKYDLAIQYFDQSLDMATDEGILTKGEIEMRLLFTLGMAYKQSGDWQNAEQLLNQVCFAENLTDSFQTGACIELTPPTQPITSTATLLPTTATPGPTLPTAIIQPTNTLLPPQTTTPTPTLLPPPPSPSAAPPPTLLPTAPPP